MGDAGQAAGGILLLVENPNKVRARSDKWDKDKIVSGAGSKNIPCLQFAHDLLLADRTNDQQSLNEAWDALGGYFAHGRVHGQFHGEEYSTIYWRWIVIPIWIAGVIAEKRGVAHIAQQVDQWLQDFITMNTLSALPETKYFQSEHAKNPGQQLFGMPCAGIMGARSWVMNEGDDGHRDFDDSMSWVDATSHAPWLAWVLGKGTLAQLRGGDGWVADVTSQVRTERGAEPGQLPTTPCREHGVWPVQANGDWSYDQRDLVRGRAELHKRQHQFHARKSSTVWYSILPCVRGSPPAEAQ